MSAPDFTEMDAIRAALDVADRKRGGRTPKWLTSALTEPARPPRLHAEPAGLGAADLLAALHGEPTDDDEDGDDPPVAA